MTQPMLFSFQSNREFAAQMAKVLHMKISPIEERDFDDGEHKIRPLIDVQGADVFVVQSLYFEETDSINDKFCKLLFFISTLKQNAAQTVTAVIPYMGYFRKDRQTKVRDPVTTRYVAQLLEASGCDRVMTMDVHNLSAYQNAFRCEAHHLEGKELFAEHFFNKIKSRGDWAVISPDIGGVKRAENFRARLEDLSGKQVDLGFFEKKRSMGELSGDIFAGEVRGKNIIVFDDIIATGSTLERAIKSCVERGCREVYVAATHGLFVGNANGLICELPLEELVVMDTVPTFKLLNEEICHKLLVLSSAPQFAKAIAHVNQSLDDH